MTCVHGAGGMHTGRERSARFGTPGTGILIPAGTTGMGIKGTAITGAGTIGTGTGAGTIGTGTGAGTMGTHSRRLGSGQFELPFGYASLTVIG
jgi:hypothetical protein